MGLDVHVWLGAEKTMMWSPHSVCGERYNCYKFGKTRLCHIFFVPVRSISSLPPYTHRLILFVKFLL